MNSYQPLMSQAGFLNTHQVEAWDEQGNRRELSIAGESPLTIYLDKKEVVTLMTLGSRPELLTLGYLRNQGFIDSIEQVKAIQVDWEVEAVAVVTHEGVEGLEQKLQHRTITTGCGQGTVFGGLMEKIDQIQLPDVRLPQSQIYGLLDSLRQQNEIYKQAGAVHGCALCQGTEVLSFVEDVGRHNAVDTLAGEMLLQRRQGDDKIFYTTGRLTSEMVIKVAQMGIPILLSRSGVTRMGMELARQVGLTLIGRAKGKSFLVFNGQQRIDYDQKPEPMPHSQKRGQKRGSKEASP
ncbi:formate dehydrogenase accessory sulfurtransferase FdhD [Motiliproteus coralliicola]|uniref:Sulfur carrier protein FdhD n=1 Tax=Motiliproteus coralliicola TaxID=2283196 RepID=A0A369WMG1_9GAMM|nr:formate dehydrogenase accessory sulfurtransferase FdhD [Motiliproteus coralliicola]RDE22902.1 formate dehydrogenase accessory sulfurtransferase FdhD [Motiliproteus coralliicola]